MSNTATMGSSQRQLGIQRCRQAPCTCHQGGGGERSLFDICIAVSGGVFDAQTDLSTTGHYYYMYRFSNGNSRQPCDRPHGGTLNGNCVSANKIADNNKHECDSTFT